MLNRLLRGTKRVLKSTKASLSKVASLTRRSQEYAQATPSESSNDVVVHVSAAAPPLPAQGGQDVDLGPAAGTDGVVQVYLVRNIGEAVQESLLSVQSRSSSRLENTIPFPVLPSPTSVPRSSNRNSDADPLGQFSVSSGVSYANDLGTSSSITAHRDAAVQAEEPLRPRSDLRSRSTSRRRSNIVWSDRREAPTVYWRARRTRASGPRADSVKTGGAANEAVAGPQNAIVRPIPVRPPRDGVLPLEDFLNESYRGVPNDCSGPAEQPRSPTTVEFRGNFEVSSTGATGGDTTPRHHARTARSRRRSVERIGRVALGSWVPRSADVVDAQRGWQVPQLNYMRLPRGSARHRTWLTGGILGYGAYGVVYFVQHVRTQQEFAMKVVNYASGMSRSARRGLINELRTLQMFAGYGERLSPFVMGPSLGAERWAWRSSDGFIHMLTDVCGGGTLGDYRGKLWPQTLRLVAAEVVLGIQFLHSKGIIHHDLKLDNVLVTGSGHCVITDFGGVKFTRTGRLVRDPLEDVIFTPEFGAPELHEKAVGQTYDGTVDYFSLGAIMSTLVIVLDGDERLLARDHSTVEEDVIRILGLLVKLRLSSDFTDFVSELLMLDPADRPNDETVRDAHYFSRLSERDWEDIQDGRTPPFPYVRTPLLMAHGSSVRHRPSVHSVDFLDMLDAERIELELDESFDVRVQHQAVVCDL